MEWWAGVVVRKKIGCRSDLGRLTGNDSRAMQIASSLGAIWARRHEVEGTGTKGERERHYATLVIGDA